jgi:Kef-type K+ transport system membrane component KefB/Trk K+ transport system NAD-binding subunit
MDHIFTEISLLLAISAGIALLMRYLRQPLIIGHILTGILVGPSLLGLVSSPETIEVFGSFGIALLLFIVGLGLNPRVVKEVGRVSLLTGVGQVLFTSFFGFMLVRALGYSAVAAFYISIALTFSSTIIILKLLTDKKEQNKLYGKISIGFLLVQDLIATVALLLASATGRGGLSYDALLALSVKGLILGLLLFIVSHYVLRPMTGFLSRSQELLFLFALSWGFGVAAVFYELGFSLEVGALFAGVALSTMPYTQEIGSRLRPLRDFFIVVFFIALGAKLNLGDVSGILAQAIFLSTFVLIGNPIIVMVIMGLLGYTKKNSFKAGLTVAQISEFSLIFMLLGLRNGQVSETAVSLVTIIGIITITLSSYMIIYADSLYRFMERYLKLFERRKVKAEKEVRHSYDAVLVGYRRGGSEFVKAFKNVTNKFIVIDYDPDAIDEMERKQIPYVYGDAADLELLEEIDLARTQLLVSTITDHDTNVFLLQHLARVNPRAMAVCHANTAEEAAQLYILGASYVVIPHYIGSEKISSFIKKNGFKKSEFKRYRQKHLAYLQAHYDALSETPA